jgi:hypothetical protein
MHKRCMLICSSFFAKRIYGCTELMQICHCAFACRPGWCMASCMQNTHYVHTHKWHKCAEHIFFKRIWTTTAKYSKYMSMIISFYPLCLGLLTVGICHFSWLVFMHACLHTSRSNLPTFATNTQPSFYLIHVNHWAEPGRAPLRNTLYYVRGRHAQQFLCSAYFSVRYSEMKCSPTYEL